MGPLVSVEWLAAHLTEVHVVDVRWYLPTTGKSGRAEYAAGHLPRAVFLDVDQDLADPPSAAAGRHPLPSPERFAAAMARAGVSDRDDVVAYDDTGGSTAARVWWLCQAYGHRGRTAVLDGGIAAWRAAGHATTTVVPDPPRGRFHAALDPSLVVTIEELERLRGTPGVVILDARATERYLGKTEPIDARPGHIPSAISAPFADNLTQGRFKSADELRARYASLGVGDRTTVVAYCGSGVTACHDLLALELAGLGGKRFLYGGSYGQWAADPTREVERD
jgi:thiosulfate/3-mercaptopyruvate sulfurtransferase